MTLDRRGSVTVGGARPLRAALARTAAVLVVAGAVALVAATVGEPADRGEGAIMSVRLPPSAFTLGLDTLVGAFLAAAALLGAGLLWALMTTRVARRRPWPRERVILVALLAAAGAAAFVWLLEGSALDGRLGGLGDQWGGLERLEGLRAPSGGGAQASVAARRAAVAAGALALLAGAAAWWWWLRDPVDEAAGDDADAGTAMVADAVEAALADIDKERDPRLAILRCYARLDLALAEAGCARAPAETAREHQRRAADALGPGAEAAARLVARFERARYDAEPVSDADRRDAVAALRAARAALAAGSGAADDPPTASPGRRGRPANPGPRP